MSRSAEWRYVLGPLEIGFRISELSATADVAPEDAFTGKDALALSVAGSVGRSQEGSASGEEEGQVRREEVGSGDSPASSRPVS